jgi:aarF domain-containing kinase
LSSVARTNPGFRGSERAVPASPFARVLGFGSLAARLAAGTVAEKAAGFFSGGGDGSASGAPADAGPRKSSFLSPKNMERLVEGLCRMRGAALKIGQMLSIQDESLLSPELAAVMARVRQGADVMPRAQLEAQMAAEFGGPGWRARVFAEFEDAPIAAASIGQVHRAALPSGALVAVKVQYPGVARSINSDIDNLTKLLTMVSLTPKGLYLDQAMSSAKTELTLECNYAYEADAQEHFRMLVDAEPALAGRVSVPRVFREASTARVLTTELVRGVPVDKIVLKGPAGAITPAVAAESGLSGSGFKDEAVQARAAAAGAGAGVLPAHVTLTQQQRDALGTLLMRVTLRELFTWRFMQTDPNWSNFLYDPIDNKVHLIDFGASRRYKKAFVDEYLRMVRACGAGDDAAIIDASIKIGFLTGDETKEMVENHVATAKIIGEPFGHKGPYDFVVGNIAARVAPRAGEMAHSRLAPPPMEAYTLHRKLAGAFLTLRRLGAVVDVGKLFTEITGTYVYGPESAEEEEISRRFK